MGFFDRFSKKKESVLPKEDDSKNFGYDPSMYELTDADDSYRPPEHISYGDRTDLLDDWQKLHQDVMEAQKKGENGLKELEKVQQFVDGLNKNFEKEVREFEKKSEKEDAESQQVLDGLNKNLEKEVREFEKKSEKEKAQSEKEASDWATDITARLAQLGHAPGAQRANEVASQEARELYKKINEERFQQKLGKAFAQVKSYAGWKELRIRTTNAEKIENLIIQGKEMMTIACGSDRNFDEKDLLFPYLVEKEAMGILKKNEQEMLSKIREKYLQVDFALTSTMLISIMVNSTLFDCDYEEAIELFPNCHSYMTSIAKKYHGRSSEKEHLNAFVNSHFKDSKEPADSLEEGKKHR